MGWLYAVFFLLTMAQSLPLTAIQVVLNRDLGLQERPEELNRFFAVEFSMSMLKLVYAAVSDLLPIARRRRVPYMMIGGVMYAVMLQAYASVHTIGQLYAAGVCSAIFAICETGADGLLVQLSGEDPRRAMSTQATGMLARSAGSFVATALSIPLLAAVPARACISAADCSRWPPQPQPRKSPRNKSSFTQTTRRAALARGTRRGATAARVRGSRRVRGSGV